MKICPQKNRSPDRRSRFRAIEQAALETASERLGAIETGQRATFLLGVRSAPLLFGYGLFIAEQSIADCLGRLFFFTREGEFFFRVFNRIFPDGRLGDRDLPQTAILEVSRLATFSASLRTLSIAEMMRIWNLYRSQSIFALGKSLGIDPLVLGNACARHSLELRENIIHPWRDERVKSLFADRDFNRIVVEKISTDRRSALAYFAQRGILDADAKIGVVDIGWRGTIQDNLALIMPSNTFVGYYMGLQRFLNTQPSNCVKRAYGPNANRDLLFSHLLDAVSPIEMLCNSPHGSVMNYRADADGVVRARRLIEPSESLVYSDIVSHFQDGVLSAIPHWAAAAQRHEIRSVDLRETACEIWSDLITKPERQIARAYATLNHNDVFGAGCFVDKKVVPSPVKLFRGLISSADRREVILYIKQTQWTSGLWHRSDLAVFHKIILVAALATGRAYKRARMWIHHHLLDKRNSR